MTTKKVILLIFFELCLMFSSVFGNIRARDGNFEVYLREIMFKYNSWLIENNLDPTPVISESISMESTDLAKIMFSCVIKNQQIRNYSTDSYPSIFVLSEFSKQKFDVRRSFSDSYQITGSFSCTGKLLKIFYTRLPEDIIFSGTGDFIVNASEFHEHVVFENVGITQNYKLNLTNKHDYASAYFMEPKWTVTNKWNNTELINYYHEDIAEELVKLYGQFLLVGRQRMSNYINPAYALLEKYLRNCTENLDLKTILPEDDLPDPVEATAFPVETTTPYAPTTQHAEAASLQSISTLALLLLSTFLIRV